jgi:hypothetical protein
MRRDVENDAVRVAELILGIGGGVTGRPLMELAAVRFDLLSHCIDVVHPDAKMVQADEILATLIAGILLGLELKQRDVSSFRPKARWPPAIAKHARSRTSPRKI